MPRKSVRLVERASKKEAKLHSAFSRQFMTFFPAPCKSLGDRSEARAAMMKSATASAIVIITHIAKSPDRLT